MSNTTLPEETKHPWDFNATFHISGQGQARNSNIMRNPIYPSAPHEDDVPQLPSVPNSADTSLADDIDFDDLTRRFDRLKRTR